MFERVAEVIHRGGVLLREYKVVRQENGQAARLQSLVMNGQM